MSRFLSRSHGLPVAGDGYWCRLPLVAHSAANSTAPFRTVFGSLIRAIVRHVTGSSRRLYAIIDVDACQSRGFDILAFARHVCAGRPAFVQLRAKHVGPRDTLDLLRALIALARPQGIKVFANDRPDLAWLSGADGVHVGQNDLPVALARATSPGLLVGVSTHTEAQLRDALGDRPDYVAFGPIFATASKADAETAVGLSGLELAAQLARAAGVPLVAIGGIDRERAPKVAKHADIIAVIGALIPATGRLEDVTSIVQELDATIGSS